MRTLWLALLTICVSAPTFAATPGPKPLQALIDATPDGGVLSPPAGVYAGPAIINRPMTLDGANVVVLSGEGVGTVLTLSGRQITVERVKIENSGSRHENLDSCLRLDNASFSVVRDNDLESCLIGIDLRQAASNVVRRNRIHGTEPEFDIRGDGMRIWRSDDNRIENNVIIDHRDVLFEYSYRNQLVGNVISGGRYGTHFMNASHNLAKGNIYTLNTVGLFSMYSDDLCLVENRIIHANGPAGIGIGLKEASGLTIENNEILGNATGLYVDGSPFDPDSVNRFRGNRWAFNGVAIQFHANNAGNTFERNMFSSNYTDVSAQGGNGATATNWRGNFWDAYEGFDRRGRGLGDTPFEVFAYADQLWLDVPMTGFYRGSPVFETIDFLARLAPFSEPVLVLRDEAPMTRQESPPPPDCGSDHGALAN
jgi:nitrous oxidase accessory protein